MATLTRTTLGKLEVGTRFQLPASTNIWQVMEHDRPNERVRVHAVGKTTLGGRWWLALMEVDIDANPFQYRAETPADRYRLTVEVDVKDLALLLAYAQTRIAASWGTTLEDITSGGESPTERALIEALLFSNENPSPDDYGIEFPGIVKIEKVG